MVVDQSGAVGTIFQGRQYYVYAQVDDQGNPPSGTRTVTADVSSFSGGSTIATLTPGSYSVASVTYNFRSPTQTASLILGPGEKPYTLTMTDALGQSATQTYNGKIGTVCAASSFSTANGRNQGKKVDRDDVISYAFTTPIDTRSIISYWTGGGVGVTVLLTDRGSNDALTILNQSTGQATPLGTVTMQGNFALGDVRLAGTILLQRNDTVVVEVGDLYGGTGLPLTVNSKTAMTWSPAAGITDTNGYPCATTSVTQPNAVFNF